MQRRSGDKRTVGKVFSGIGQGEITCVARLVILLFYFSCSGMVHRLENVDIDTFRRSMDFVCLSGEGSGDVQFLSSRYSFSFESLLEEKNTRWMLALIFPLQGEELMSLDYSLAYEGKGRLGGGFYDRLIHGASKSKQSDYYLGMLTQFLSNYAIFLKFYHDRSVFDYKQCEVKDKRGRCQLTMKHHLYFEKRGDNLNIIFNLDDQSNFIISFSNLSNKAYRRIQLHFENPNEGGMHRRPVHMDLKLSTCDR